MKRSDLKDALLSEKNVTYGGKLYEKITAIICRKNEKGGMLIQTEIKDMKANSVLVVNADDIRCNSEPLNLKDRIKNKIKSLHDWRVVTFERIAVDQAVILCEKVNEHYFCVWNFNLKTNQLHDDRYGSYEKIKPIYKKRLELYE